LSEGVRCLGSRLGRLYQAKIKVASTMVITVTNDATAH